MNLATAGDHMPGRCPPDPRPVNGIHDLPNGRSVDPAKKWRVAKPELDRAIERRHLQVFQVAKQLFQALMSEAPIIRKGVVRPRGRILVPVIGMEKWDRQEQCSAWSKDAFQFAGRGERVGDMLEDFQANDAIEGFVGKVERADVDVQVAIVLAHVGPGLVTGSLVILPIEPMLDRPQFFAESILRSDVEHVISAFDRICERGSENLKGSSSNNAHQI